MKRIVDIDGNVVTLDDAIIVFKNDHNASRSSLQRKLLIGWVDACFIVSELIKREILIQGEVSLKLKYKRCRR